MKLQHIKYHRRRKGKCDVYLFEFSEYTPTYHSPHEHHQDLTFWVPHTSLIAQCLCVTFAAISVKLNELLLV